MFKTLIRIAAVAALALAALPGGPAQAEDLCADRDFEKLFFAAPAGAVFALAMATVVGHEAWGEMIIGQIRNVFIGDQDDVAAGATIPAVGAARVLKLFPAKRNTAIATVASLGADSNFVNKHASKIAEKAAS